MARGKKKKPRSDARKAKQPRDAAVDAVSELISVLACPKAVVNELGLAAESAIDDMDVACGFARFASTTWARRPGEFAEIDEIARALVVEYERHASALAAILDRLAPLADENEESEHEDLDPMDVLGRVQPMLESTSEAPA